MAEISDYVPADGVRFDKAFERLFEMDPRTAELRAKLDGGTGYDDAVDGWDAVRKDVDLVFRTDLRNGALNAYQRDPYTGEELKVLSKDWESAAILPGEELAFPPIYFLKSEFEAWLLNVSGRVSGRQTQER
jgi:hypothetical protein